MFPWRRWHLICALVVLPLFLTGHFVFLFELTRETSIENMPGLGATPINLWLAPVFYLSSAFFLFSSVVVFHEGQSNIFNYVSPENLVYTLFRASCVGIVLLVAVLFFSGKALLVYPSLIVFGKEDVSEFLTLSHSFVLHLSLVVLSAFVLGVSLWKMILRSGFLKKVRSQRLFLWVGLLFGASLVLMDFGLLVKGGVIP